MKEHLKNSDSTYSRLPDSWLSYRHVCSPVLVFDAHRGGDGERTPSATGEGSELFGAVFLGSSRISFLRDIFLRDGDSELGTDSERRAKYESPILSAKCGHGWVTDWHSRLLMANQKNKHCSSTLSPLSLNGTFFKIIFGNAILNRTSPCESLKIDLRLKIKIEFYNHHWISLNTGEEECDSFKKRLHSNQQALVSPVIVFKLKIEIVASYL